MTDAALFSARDSSPWAGVAALVDRAKSLDDLRLHRIELLAARRWREKGISVPPDLAEDELRASVLVLAGQALLRRVRESCDGSVIVLKGPEVAAYYPDPALRSSIDIDLLVPDAERTQRQLLAAGFREVGDPEKFLGIQHLRPLAWPTIPLSVEIHERPKWPGGMATPSTAALFDLTTQSATGVEGLLALTRAHHALVVAAHSWAHVPLSRLRDLVDVAALSQGVPRTELNGLARAWGVERLWRSTADVMDALLYGHRAPLSLRVWARHLTQVRERTVVEHQMRRFLSPFWAFPPQVAAVRMARAHAKRSRLFGARDGGGGVRAT